MRSYLSCCAVILVASVATAAELKFDFSEVKENQTPPGFHSVVTGQGKSGDWKVIMDDVPPMLAPLTTNPPPATIGGVITKRPVLAQLSQDPTDEHFPLLVYTNETFGDFTLTTRFKIVDGKEEQMAGVAFYVQNENNYCYIRASSLGTSFAFFVYQKGERVSGPIGSKVGISKGEWHEMKIECKGNDINGYLDGQLRTSAHQLMYLRGKIGFWTKSDSVSYFADTKIVYTPLEVPAQVFVRQTLKKYPRLLDLRVYISGNDAKGARLIAARDEKNQDTDGEATALKVIHQAAIYYAKGSGSVIVTMPLRDRNGEAIGAVQVVMKSFPGQTEQNALARAQPIVHELQAKVQTVQDLLE
jgi:hypothetical protein